MVLTQNGKNGLKPDLLHQLFQGPLLRRKSVQLIRMKRVVSRRSSKLPRQNRQKLGLPNMTKTPTLSLDLSSTIMLLLLAAVWGGSFFFGEIALREVPPLTITLHRVIWAVPFLALVVIFKGIAVPRSRRVWGAYLVMGALNNAIPFSLIFWGQTQIESGLASILNGTTAMFAAVVAGLLLPDEPLTAKKIIGAALGIAGVAHPWLPDDPIDSLPYM